MLFIRILFFSDANKDYLCVFLETFSGLFSSLQLQESIKLVSVYVDTNNTENNFNPEIELNIANSHLYTWLSAGLETTHSKLIYLAMFISYRNGV